ncbi:hypothetical protein [Sulfurisphaera ohwakuensis]|uniref:Uncharacterized protein n=1 Tax=Sulfurisphaera ohwakuensis TaxID=69656 RepID=A0A650CKF9_SULOH|nr:hypothetical protein [Sulfurisphaera ohwakuensis]MBB5254777.1 hypothetical protein [Sulfurisphaera ohwakuensis]QGR18238.1 hypothetical protein D1869_14360 [Sulfurisphaera ohwakuensis]
MISFYHLLVLLDVVIYVETKPIVENTTVSPPGIEVVVVKSSNVSLTYGNILKSYYVLWSEIELLFTGPKPPQYHVQVNATEIIYKEK